MLIKENQCFIQRPFFLSYGFDILLALKDAGFLLRQAPRGADSFGECLLLTALLHRSLGRLIWLVQPPLY